MKCCGHEWGEEVMRCLICDKRFKKSDGWKYL